MYLMPRGGLRRKFLFVFLVFFFKKKVFSFQKGIEEKLFYDPKFLQNNTLASYSPTS